jgi:crotonobetainyl-CoA:carnitine CoA-transferase CaiB-like acyl-CoA transferase
MKEPELTTNPLFASFADRQKNQATLDQKIGDWTRRFDALALEHQLQGVGVAAHVVANTFDMTADPQLAHREHFVEVPHGTLGKTWVENSRYKLSRTPAKVERSAPALGEHNQYVLEKILGYTEEQVTELVTRGALS